MFVDQLKMPNEARLNQILHTLEHVHQFVFESFEPQLLQTLEQQYSAAKATIVETSAFNSYHANPDYVKASLITEALRLLTEIAPSRRKKNIKESTQHKDPTMTKLNEKAKKAKPDFLDVDKDGDRKESFKKALADKKRAKVDEATTDDEDIEKAKAEFFKKGRQVTYGNPRVAKGARFHRGKFSGHLDKTGSSQADAPGMQVTSIRQKPKIYEDQNLDQAETLLAAKDLSDRLQDMAEDAAKMAVDRLMPLVDTMKGQFGQPAAEGFNQVVKDNLQKVLDTIIAAKDQTDNAILTLQGGGTPEMAGDISQPLPAEPGATPDGEEGADIDFDKEFDAMAATSGPEQEPLGRAKKSELDEGRHDGNAYEMGYRAGVNEQNMVNNASKMRPDHEKMAQKLAVYFKTKRQPELLSGEFKTPQGQKYMKSIVKQWLSHEPGYTSPSDKDVNWTAMLLGQHLGIDIPFSEAASGRAKKSELDEGRDDGNAYEMGYRAGVNDRSSDNPFEGKDEFRAGEWEDGYKDGRKEDGLDE